jgi:hypothetical protein
LKQDFSKFPERGSCDAVISLSGMRCGPMGHLGIFWQGGGRMPCFAACQRPAQGDFCAGGRDRGGDGTAVAQTGAGAGWTGSCVRPAGHPALCFDRVPPGRQDIGGGDGQSATSPCDDVQNSGGASSGRFSCNGGCPLGVVSNSSGQILPRAILASSATGISSGFLPFRHRLFCLRPIRLSSAPGRSITGGPL